MQDDIRPPGQATSTSEEQVTPKVPSAVAEERRRKLLELFPNALAVSGVVQDGGTLVYESLAEVDFEGFLLKVNCTYKRSFREFNPPETALQSEDAARSYGQDVARIFKTQADNLLQTFKNKLAEFTEISNSQECETYLGPKKAGSASWSRRYLAPLLGASPIKVRNSVAIVDRAISALKTDLRNEKFAALAQRFKGHPEIQIKKRSALKKMLVNLPIRSATMTLQYELAYNINLQSLDRYLAMGNDEVAAEIEKGLNPLVSEMTAGLVDQVASLVRKISKLPHIELLADDAICKVVTPFYSSRDQTPKKQRSRNALVAVEEKAREAKYRGDVEKLEVHREDYADVAQYYPIARSLGRKLVLYVGPTNSGKTWRALNDLAEGDSGVYLAPLRLLALEGQEEVEKRGKTTSYVTGEERDVRPDATFVSSTIEMMDYDRQVDRVVIDEVQLLADYKRGWAWLAAVVGSPAKRVIMTGSPDCVEMVQWLAEYLEEPLEIVECQRYNELKVADVPSALDHLASGTAVVCFSRHDVLSIKAIIEESGSHKVAVVYGNLSPQVRREEARRFRSGEADILVATDAIAMGLNLPIHHVVFYKTEKFDGESTRTLSASEIRQIGGRAGRYGFAQFGVVSALNPQSLGIVRHALNAAQRPLLERYYVAPGPNHIRIIGKVLETESLERILTFFEKAMEFSNKNFARANIDELSFLSSYVDRALPQKTPVERLGIASAPVDLKSDSVLGWYLERMLPVFRTVDAEGKARDLLDDLFATAQDFSHESAVNTIEMRRAEDYLKTLTIYAWLSYRYPLVFPRLEDCQARRETVNAFVERSLRNSVVRRCVNCNKTLPLSHRFRICEVCFTSSRGQRRSGPHHVGGDEDFGGRGGRNDQRGGGHRRSRRG